MTPIPSEVVWQGVHRSEMTVVYTCVHVAGAAAPPSPRGPPSCAVPASAVLELPQRASAMLHIATTIRLRFIIRTPCCRSLTSSVRARLPSALDTSISIVEITEPGGGHDKAGCRSPPD